MATRQSEFGKIEIFDDFIGPEYTIAETADDSMNLGAFRVIGQGKEATDSGATIMETDPNLNGVVCLTTTDESEHSLGLTTAKMFDVALMAPIVAEIRVQFADLDTKEFYFGFTDVNDDTAILEGGNLHGATATFTLTASDLCGFHFSSELTEDEMWHCVYNGGTTTGETVSTNIESGVDAVAGEYNILRIEIDPNGTARWYVDGVLKQTVEGAVSTTTDLACMAMVEAKGEAIEYAKLDYFGIRANRDWTV